MNSSRNPPYDVAFVGTGISNTFTLIELLARLEQQNASPVRVLLIDKDADFFKGIPYGNRSGDAGLIISRVSDFLPAAQLRDFGTWLAGNRERAFERFFAVGGDFVRDWRTNFWADVESDAIDDLYLPRYIFGLYFAQLADSAIERARLQGVADCQTMIAEVIDVAHDDGGGFTLVTREGGGDESEVSARRVVLGIGSVPSKRILSPGDAVAGACVLIDDPFEPGISDALARVRAALGDATRNRVLIVGSNAGALDVIVNLLNDGQIASAIRRVDVLSTGGRFPELFYAHDRGSRPAFVARALRQLGTRDEILAEDILEAVRQDIDTGHREGLTITDTFWEISVGFNSLLGRLSAPEKLRFACDTGPRIGALRRRVGQDYWAVVDRLMRDGRLVITAGRYPTGVDLDDPDLLAVINCSGSERLSAQSHSALLTGLIARGWVRPTVSDFGIRVNDDLETDTPGLYVIGPMLTGNVLRGGPEWNLEHCGRIAQFAGQLATHLVDRAFAEHAA